MPSCKILLLAANPDGTQRLALDQEVRAITDKIDASEHRDEIELITKWAVRPDDLQQALNKHQPHVVHFSAHGRKSDEILLHDDDGRATPIRREALVSLFRTLRDEIRLVVLNACFSKPQAEAEAIVEVVEGPRCPQAQKHPQAPHSATLRTSRRRSFAGRPGR